MAQQIQARLRSFSSVIIGMLFVLISASACGDGSSDQLFQQISDPGQTITVDTLRSTTFKESREYSVEGLPGATYVSYGFLRVGGRDPYEYEIRFYESHRLAVELGTALAIEGTGKTAILNADDATYKEGVKNRRVLPYMGYVLYYSSGKLAQLAMIGLPAIILVALELRSLVTAARKNRAGSKQSPSPTGSTPGVPSVVIPGRGQPAPVPETVMPALQVAAGLTQSLAPL